MKAGFLRVKRGSTVAFGFGATLALAAAGALVHASLWTGETPKLIAMRAQVEALDLTDLALFNEARYTRHPSQADLHSAFQDGPMTIEHFPTGSLVAPARNFPAGGIFGRMPE